MVATDMHLDKNGVLPPKRGPSDPKPDCSQYDDGLINSFLMSRFQRALERDMNLKEEGVSFERIVELAVKLQRHSADNSSTVREKEDLKGLRTC